MLEGVETAGRYLADDRWPKRTRPKVPGVVYGDVWPCMMRRPRRAR